MARWATATIAGVSFAGCRVEIIDAQDFDSIYKGSSKPSSKGRPRTHLINTGVEGNTFGLRIPSIEYSKIQSVKTANQAAEALNTTFVVTAVDDEYNINVNATRDYSQAFITHGLVIDGYVEDVIMRFEVKSAV